MHTTVREREHHQLYDDGHKKDDDTEVRDETVEEVEQGDDNEFGEPSYQ